MASCLLLVGIASSAFAQGPAPSCEITGPTSVFVNEPFSLCGISGSGLTYTWVRFENGQEVVLNHDRCLDFPNGIPAVGCYDYEFTISQGPDYLKCPITVCVRERDDLECRIQVRNDCESSELCGPEGFDYSWSGAGVEGATTRCVTVTEDGTYSLTVSDGDKEGKCEVSVEIRKDCKGSCPRSPGFWGQQADQKGNGSTKYSLAQVTSIAVCISNSVDVFNWGVGNAAFLAFKATINPPKPMSNESQVKRQFAALLANVCATGVDPALWDGEVFLDTSAEVTCNGETMTIQELIDAVDDELTSATPDYGKYINCLDRINNKIGIPLDESCRAADVKDDSVQRLGGGPLGGFNVPAELSFSATNPASQSSVLRFALPADGDVSLKIFDVAGRQIADIGGGFMPAGSHTMDWNVAGVARGLYFARLSFNGEIRTQQIVVTR
jgi:hypothetical protein